MFFLVFSIVLYIKREGGLTLQDTMYINFLEYIFMDRAYCRKDRQRLNFAYNGQKSFKILVQNAKNRLSANKFSTLGLWTF